MQSSDRKLDLSDTLMLSWNKASRTIYFGLSTTDTHWRNWGEDNLSAIEKIIRYDLGFDCYYVNIKRISENQSAKCAEEFLWKLVIRSR